VKPGKEGEPGDLFVRIRVMVPKSATDKEKELWGELAKISSFNPRIES
jgi:curved DNA-binding protein